MTTINTKTAKTAELVAFYNAYADKPVKKFADRATAEKRVAGLLATMKPTAEKRERMSPQQRAERCRQGAKKAMHTFTTQKAAIEYATTWTSGSVNKKAVCSFEGKYVVCSQMTQRKHGWDVVARV